MPHGDRVRGDRAGTQSHISAPANKVTEKRWVLPTFLPACNSRSHNRQQPSNASLQ